MGSRPPREFDVSHHKPRSATAGPARRSLRAAAMLDRGRSNGTLVAIAAARLKGSLWKFTSSREYYIRRGPCSGLKRYSPVWLVFSRPLRYSAGQWIEIVFGVDPDGGDGSLEWFIVAALALVAVIFAAMARVEWRRLETPRV